MLKERNNNINNALNLQMKKIALRFSYNGTKYSGLASQTHKNTIDYFIKKALIESKLSNSEVQITYAGRTDAGVSAVDMVASLNVYALEEGRMFNYDAMLNAFLPMEIRITGFTFVNEEFSARFSCKKRKYKYFFLKNGLDLHKMREAALFFLKQKNFRNFCKGHKEKDEKYFIRPLLSLEIIEDEICTMEISSVSFLHNMIRKIFYILRKVGRNELNISELEDYFVKEMKVDTAESEFLLFFGAEYENLLFKSSIRKNEKSFLISHVQKCISQNYLIHGNK